MKFNPDSSSNQYITLSSHVSPDVIKTTGGDYLTTWYMGGLPFLGKDEYELEHKHRVFNRLLQTLRAPDFENVAFWVHDIRKRGGARLYAQFDERFNRELDQEYYDSLSSSKIMCNELYLTMLYRPNSSGKIFKKQKVTNLELLKAKEQEAIMKIGELSENLEISLRDYAPYRLGIYQGARGMLFSETLELFGYLLNRIVEPVPVLNSPIYDYLSVSKQIFSTRTGDFVITTPDSKNHYGAILNIKE